MVNIDTESEAIVVKGSYQFIDDKGETHTLTFIADENGYQPQSDDIPLAQ